MSRRFWVILVGSLLLVPVLLIVRYGDRNDAAHQAIRYWVRLYGDATYEYHSTTGRWPARIDDLARTSLPAQFPYWKHRLDEGTIVLVWNNDLKPDPHDNAGLILAYHNRVSMPSLVVFGSVGAIYGRNTSSEKSCKPKSRSEPNEPHAMLSRQHERPARSQRSRYVA
jgi:hypothetical protein